MNMRKRNLDMQIDVIEAMRKNGESDDKIIELRVTKDTFVELLSSDNLKMDNLGYGNMWSYRGYALATDNPDRNYTVEKDMLVIETVRIEHVAI